MRPGQNKRIRGRGGRKGPNPLTRSYESNGPDVKIRGTAQHIAEKYLQLARDAQSSGDTVTAESLLQHAEHYFRLIAGAQAQQTGGYGRQSFEQDADAGEDDDDFGGLPDRFAPLAERLPPAAYQPQPQPYAPQPQPPAPPHFAQPQPQPFEERPIGEDMRMDRPPRPERPFGERGRDRGRGGEGGERGRHMGFERNRDNRRFQQRGEPQTQDGGGAADAGAAGLPSFITAPPARAVSPENEAAAPFTEQERAANREHEGVNFHLSSRRRRRPRPPMGDMGDDPREVDAPASTELPLEPDRF
jgi:hypothetical protein